jgi:starch phosphorylase
MSELLPVFPDRIARLPELASDLSWSWNREARALFRSIDEHLWVRTRYDPFELFRLAGPDLLARRAADPHFVAHYDAVLARLDAWRSNGDTWFAHAYPQIADRPIAYFCAEFAVYHTVPIYSGGLGVLAGDHCKAASDLGVPLVGVGALYRGGYFDQRIRADGWQEETTVALNLEAVPLEPAAPLGSHVASVAMNGREVFIQAWRLRVGRASIYLLDTDLDRNHPDDRQLLSNLYPGGPDRRLRQEWLLGVGGVRVLRALAIEPAAWHANEGHAAFMLIERVREQVDRGVPWADAVAAVRSSSVFTTHTPVPAGHDVFAASEVAGCAGTTWAASVADLRDYLALGAHPQDRTGAFHMTVAAIRLSERVNGVSRAHGAVTRRIWQAMWPELPEPDVPIGHVTNGVHADTWLAHSISQLLEKTGGAWAERATRPEVWDGARALDDGQLWHTHLQLKATLLRLVREESRALFVRRTHEAAQLVGSGVLLDPAALTIGFARRFATYKRASLLFHDVERLLRLLAHPARPVQIVFAGKAHPADDGGKRLLQEVYRATHDPRFEGRIAFVEDYDQHIAHVLVQGVDAWLNLPRVPLEACGTSGMKASLNGVPHISTLDGWWAEAYEPGNGWAVRTPEREDDTPEADAATATALYDVLEREVVPAYYERDAEGLPRRWISTMKEAIRMAGARFTAQRMLIEYVTKCYAPAAGAAASADPRRDVRNLHD